MSRRWVDRTCFLLEFNGLGSVDNRTESNRHIIHCVLGVLKPDFVLGGEEDVRRLTGKCLKISQNKLWFVTSRFQPEGGQKKFCDVFIDKKCPSVSMTFPRYTLQVVVFITTQKLVWSNLL